MKISAVFQCTKGNVKGPCALQKSINSFLYSYKDVETPFLRFANFGVAACVVFTGNKTRAVATRI